MADRDRHPQFAPPPTPGLPARGGEEGAALILALVFMIVVGMLATVLLSMAFVGARSTHSYRQQRALRYNAESAVNLTIGRLADDPLLGTPASPDCGGVTFVMVQNAALEAEASFVDGSSLQIECEPTPTSAIPQSEEARDVTITVVCAEKETDSRLIRCGGAGTTTRTRTLGVVRVRFEPNLTVSTPGERAVVPKVVSWDTME